MSTDVDDKQQVDEKLAGELVEKKRRRRNERNAAMYDDEVFELLQAVDAWRRKSHRSFPAWSEVITIMKSLGWQKTGAVAPAAAAPATVEPMEEVQPKPE